MPTFRKIPEIVDARQFTGGVENGSNLVLWVNSENGSATWEDEHVKWRHGDHVGMTPESIRVYTGPYRVESEVAFVGDWIMRRQDGSFEVVRQQTLDSEYVQV